MLRTGRQVTLRSKSRKTDLVEARSSHQRDSTGSVLKTGPGALSPASSSSVPRPGEIARAPGLCYVGVLFVPWRIAARESSKRWGPQHALFALS